MENDSHNRIAQSTIRGDTLKRCSHVYNKTGEVCDKFALEGSNFCHVHSTPKQRQKAYLLNHISLSDATDRHSNTEIASLRDEIALTRALIEHRLNLITNNSELLAACGQVNALLLTLERLMLASLKVEEKLGELLSKTAVIELASEIVAILTEELQNVEGFEAIIDTIGQRIGTVISNKK